MRIICVLEDMYICISKRYLGKLLRQRFQKKMFPLNGGRGDGHVQWNGQGDILQYSMSYILGEIYIYIRIIAQWLYIYILYCIIIVFCNTACIKL